MEQRMIQYGRKIMNVCLMMTVLTVTTKHTDVFVIFHYHNTNILTLVIISIHKIYHANTKWHNNLANVNMDIILKVEVSEWACLIFR
jgi:hypothetical protein